MFIGGDVFDPFAKVWTHLKVKKEHIWTDNWIYLLHRKWSFILSFIALIGISSYVAVIDATIRCFTHADITEEYMSFYCWVRGTYIVPDYLESPVGDTTPYHVPHPGIGQEKDGNYTRLYQNHYVFYPLIILFQVCSFHFTKHFWKTFEGGRLKTLISELSSPTVTAEKMKERIQLVTNYMTTYSVTFLSNYSSYYVMCEVWNLFNVILQFFTFNIVFYNGFLTYGIDAVRYISQDPPGYPSPFNRMFPKVTKCEFKEFGPSGERRAVESLCIMPLNNFAEKVFLLAWFWMTALIIITSLGLIYRALVIFSPRARYFVLRFKTLGSLCEPKWINYFVHHSNHGTWFVVSMIEKNVSPWVFANFMRELHDKMKEVQEKIY